MSGKTSFKTLLKAGSSNPKVNLQSVRTQRDRLEKLKERPAAPGAPASKVLRGPTAQPALLQSQPEQPAATIKGASSSAPTFVPSARFVGARPGYVFKLDQRGLGYYSDGLLVEGGGPSVAKISEPHTLDPGAIAEARGALPTDFFDNPQQDPANAGKTVAHTRKEETLRQEMDEFNKLVSEDLAAAAEADIEEEDDEEEGKLREAVDLARHLETRVNQLRSLVGTRSESEPKRGDHKVVGGGSSGDGASGEVGKDDSDEDDENDEEDVDEEQTAMLSLDWRAKGI